MSGILESFRHLKKLKIRQNTQTNHENDLDYAQHNGISM